MKTKNSTNYIDKKELYDELVKWNDAGQPDPMPDSLGIAFIKIVNGIAARPNFSGYSYIDEMKADGLVSCIEAAPKFDPTHKLKNPFGFFSRTIWWAFLRRIEREHKESYKRHKSYENHMLERALVGETYLSENQDLHGVNADLLKKFEK